MEKYDVAIIGSGIGGLTCGCYLAKAGLKVLIVEQHDKPGGYCTSFERQGYRFDAGVHYLGSLREGGTLFKILKDFELLDKIRFITSDPTDRIVTPSRTIFIRRDKDKTKDELIKHFPQEKENINRFFHLVLIRNLVYIFSKTKNMTFQKLLDSFFKDKHLKEILATLLGNLGLPPSRASAFVSLVIFREFVFDGGYYPQGGMQVFSDLLACRFQEYGGNLSLSTKAIRILTERRQVVGVKLENDEVINAKFVVSNSDATLTFKKLVDCKTKEAKMVDRLEVSHSAFIIYLGLKTKLNIKPKHFTTLYFFTDNIEKCYSRKADLSKLSRLNYMFCTFSSLVDPSLAPLGKSTMRIFIGVDNRRRKLYNQRRKEKLYKRVIDKISNIIPGLQDSIEVRELATPQSFINYTCNRDGALFGWSAVPSQIDRKIFPNRTSIENLYLSGHWVTNGVGQSGVAVVAFSGKRTAERIIRCSKRDSLF